MNGLDGVAHLRADLRHLEAGVGGIAAAVVEKVTDVMSTEYVNEALVFGAVFIETFQLVAARAEGAAGSAHQSFQRSTGLLRCIDELFS